MTIKVAGTTVIGDRRELQNIASLTVNGTSFIDAMSDSSIITSLPNTSSVITINAALGNHFATTVTDPSNFGVIYKETFTKTSLPYIPPYNTFTVSLPSYLKSGDIVRVVISSTAFTTSAISVGPSYTKTTVREYTASLHCSYIFSKNMSSTPDTSFTITNESLNTIDLSILVFVTRLEVTNYSVNATTGNSTSGTITLTPLSITNATAGVVLVYGFTNTWASSATVSAPPGFTLIGKSSLPGATAMAGFLRITSTQTVTPGSFLGTLGTGVWSAYTDSRQVIAGSGNPSITFSNVPTRYSCTLELDYYGGTITWPNTTYWDMPVAPTFQKGTKNLVMLTTYNSGTTWNATVTQGYRL